MSSDSRNAESAAASVSGAKRVLEICTSSRRDVFAVRTEDNRIAVLDIAGRVLSPVLMTVERHDSAYMAIDPENDILFVGLWRKRTIEAFHWPSGRSLWRRTSHVEIYYMQWHRRGLIVQHHSGLCQHIDAQTGKRLEELRGIADVHVGDGLGPVVLTHRTAGRSWPRRVEFRDSVEGEVLGTDDTTCEYALQHTSGDGWIALSVAGAAGLRVYTTFGRRVWKFDLEDYHGHFFGITAINGGRDVFGILRGFDHPVLALALRLDGRDGRELSREPLDSKHVASHPISGERLAEAYGVLDTKTLSWTKMELHA